MRQTSIEAYKEILPQLSPRQQKVLDIIRTNGRMTNTEISVKLKMPINQITPRVNELVKKGILEHKITRKCSITNRTCMVWGLVRVDWYEIP